ncbi:hypothetical protein [Bacillus sp. SRB3LM]|uniref:hypothetical protein n=1 Tax=Bacillus sp. SRB3LM TaxID=2608689 RepID=UPI0018C352C3|nr:hypothetical protein [Bacillus sp. SRB3LM]
MNSSILYAVDTVKTGEVFGLSYKAVRKDHTVRIKDTRFSSNLFLETKLIVVESIKK